jgi:hypothetical protein
MYVSLAQDLSATVLTTTIVDNHTFAFDVDGSQVSCEIYEAGRH